MFKKIFLVLDTVKNLKFTQILHQIIYRIKAPGLLTAYIKPDEVVIPNCLNFRKRPPVYSCLRKTNVFKFLNQEVDFGEVIDWNFQGNGKLWNYNLQYGNYLMQADLGIEEKIVLINSLQNWLSSGKLPLEPYPSSLRAINITRLMSEHKISDQSILKNLYGEFNFLSKRPEYHLLGNHLLENAFAIMMGGAFFSNKYWLEQGEEILQKELDEQILSDGAHFELSPMYHQIIVFRVLEFIDWYSSYKSKKSSFEYFIRLKASEMMSWLNNMTFANGDIPHFNDSSNGIAYSTEWLNKYAKILDVKQTSLLPLKESGYRAIRNGNFECIIDLAEIGPSYQPGHGHADALSFILHYKNVPLIIEQGTSTYQIGEKRNLERSTSAHNTVVIGGNNQSAVWSGFRVGARAKVNLLLDSPLKIIANHTGYKSLGLIHQRTFEFSYRVINIIDEINGGQSNNNLAYFHFHPDIKVKLSPVDLTLGEYGSVKFIGAKALDIEEFDMADGFNNYIKGQRVVVCFDRELKTEIHLI